MMSSFLGAHYWRMQAGYNRYSGSLVGIHVLIVLVHDDVEDRRMWRLGVAVKMSKGGNKGIISKMPYQSGPLDEMR